MFKGLSAFPITPMDADGRVDTDNLATLLDGMVTAGVDSVGLLGSTGSYMFLSREERLRAVRCAVEVIANRVPLIVGVGAIRTTEATALARDAKGAGADGVLLAPVAYNPLTEAEAFGLYQTVANATDLPLCIYNNPGTTQFTFSHDLIVRLAELPNIATVKMPPTQDIAAEVSALRSRVPDDFAIGYSGDWIVGQSILAGADVFYSGISGVMPNEFVALTRAAQAGDRAKVEELEARLEPLWALCKTFGSARLAYAIARAKGLTKAQPPLPLRPIPDGEIDKLDGLI